MPLTLKYQIFILHLSPIQKNFQQHSFLFNVVKEEKTTREKSSSKYFFSTLGFSLSKQTSIVLLVNIKQRVVFSNFILSYVLRMKLRLHTRRQILTITIKRIVFSVKIPSWLTEWQKRRSTWYRIPTTIPPLCTSSSSVPSY